MIRKILASLVVCFFLVGCADGNYLPGKDGSKTWYDSVGLFNKHNKASHICYGIVVGNVVWSIVTIETVVLPLYFIGWSIMEPRGLKTEAENPEGCW